MRPSRMFGSFVRVAFEVSGARATAAVMGRSPLIVGGSACEAPCGAKDTTVARPRKRPAAELGGGALVDCGILRGPVPRFAVLLLLAWAWACDRRSKSILAPVSVATPAPSSSGEGGAAPSGTPCEGVELSAASRSGPDGGDGPTCTEYDSPRDAFLQVIARRPLVLAIGEVHAPKGASVPSAAKRFTDDLLPLLAGRASDLLVELMMSPSACPDAAAEARRIEEPVTSLHAETAQDEYVAMGERARGLGIVPDMLRPTCADLDAIRRASERSESQSQGRGDVLDVSLSTIARLSIAGAVRLVDRDELSDADRGKMVVLYGGALHNRLSPRGGPEDAARWSYAPEVSAHVHGRFVALDLIVPEFVGEGDTWRALPFWPLYESARRGAKLPKKPYEKTTVFGNVMGKDILVFPAAIPR
jgi:hypothetical protein